jgi:initiation factor 1A
MPKNKSLGGKKFKKYKKGSKTNTRTLQLAGRDETYAKVTKVLGGGRFRCILMDTSGRGEPQLKEMIGIIRNRVRTKNKGKWICPDDIVIVSIRDFGGKFVDIIYKYEREDIKNLIYTESDVSKLYEFGDSTNEISFNNENTGNRMDDISYEDEVEDTI